MVIAMMTLFLTSCQKNTSPRQETLITKWQFTHSDQIDTLPTEGWQDVTVPHDWAIAEPFDRKYDLQIVAVVQNGENQATTKTGRSGGLPWMGIGWYKTTIATPDQNKQYTLLFDGAMSHATVYANGQKAGYWAYGYNSFTVDITPFINSETTDIWVSLQNPDQSSRWYPGAGLYRNVHLIETARTHIPVWGTCIRTPEVSEQKALVSIDITIEGNTEGIDVVTYLMHGKQVVATIRGQQGTTEVIAPQLWSPESPNRYIALTQLQKDGQVIDEYTTPFGIRSLSYTKENGFMLNGERRKFKGVCNHHDMGPLGTAVHRDALRHQLTMLKDMGCDAIRTSHNMPAPELIDLCEELGLMVMVEPFDVWDWGKTDNDYHVHFNEWAERDITNMVLHYRNSPAVVMWSSGNEVWNQTWDNGYEYVERLQAIFHRLDPTRPVTCGMDQAWAIIYNGFGAATDIPGLNYRTHRYQEAYEHLPQKMILGSETASTVSSRGTYMTPVEIKPDALYENGQCSGYDVEYCSWSGLPDQDFQLADDYDWTLGQFVWTGFDYLGEPSPYDTDAWPSHSSYFGIIDLASLPKDRYYLYRSQWNKEQPTLHVLPHWNWQEGENVPVFCYTSYPAAELFVNGESQGKLRFASKEEAQRLLTGESIEGVSPLPKVGNFEVKDWGCAPRPELLPRYRLMWPNVTYHAGEIKVVAYNLEGEAVDETIIRTADAPHHLQAEIANEGEKTEEGLIYLTVSIMDEHNTLCPAATQDIHIQLNSGTLLGVANGDARCLVPFSSNHIPAFAGQATFIIQSENNHFSATFSADGLTPCTIKK